jgi:hypothetical protein
LIPAVDHFGGLEAESARGREEAVLAAANYWCSNVGNIDPTSKPALLDTCKPMARRLAQSSPHPETANRLKWHQRGWRLHWSQARHRAGMNGVSVSWFTGNLINLG